MALITRTANIDVSLRFTPPGLTCTSKYFIGRVQKNDSNDKRCLLEARFEGLDPLAITEHAASVGQAITGAADKMQRKLATVTGKLRDKHSRTGHSAPIVEAEDS